MTGKLSGNAAVRIMVEEIGEAIGPRRLREFERKVRARMVGGGTGKEWIRAMAEVIVEDDDSRADKGFRKGIRRIREQSERLGLS